MSNPLEIGNAPAKAQLTIVRGDAWYRTMRMKTGSATGPAVDLTGSVVSAAVYRSLGGPVLFDAMVAVIDALEGVVEIGISAEQSLMLKGGAYADDTSGEHWLVIRLRGTNGREASLVHARIRAIGKQ